MNLTQLHEQFQQAKILVVGDVMLDRYWFGEVSRISPEAPVPIAQIQLTEHRAGGAGNVARNIVALSGQAGLLSIVGNDEPARQLHDLMQQAGVHNHFLCDENMATILKLRVVAKNQQLIRLDFEQSPQTQSIAHIQQKFMALLPDYDAVIFSDYGKGTLANIAPLIEFAKQAQKPVLIDPKGNDYRKYQGATLLTPNRAELRQAIGDWHSEQELTEKAQNLRQQLDLTALLFTRSEEGMSLYQEQGVKHQATRAQEVYDVSGAGDTVIATMGLACAVNLPLTDAMQLANVAAGIVVAKVGTAVCHFDELRSALG